MKRIRNNYGMPKKSWKHYCDNLNKIRQRRENKEKTKNRYKQEEP